MTTITNCKHNHISYDESQRQYYCVSCSCFFEQDQRDDQELL